MNKKAKMYVGLGVVAVAAYYFYMQSKKKKETAAAPAPAKFVGAVGTTGGLNKVGRQEKF
jgi:hypothetical protein